MSQRFTIQLGELRLTKYDLGNKASFLDQIALKDLSSKGLPGPFAAIKMPVPQAGVILDEFFRHAIDTGLAHVERGQVVVDDARAFMDAIELPPLTGRVAVRSAFTDEDKADKSLAGKFDSVLDVPIESYSVSPSRVRNPEPLAHAIAQVWTSGLRGGVKGRMDVLVMRMVDAKHSGVAFTESDYEDDLINYTDGLAVDLLAGRKKGQTVELPKLKGPERLSKAHSNLPFLARLQDLLRLLRLALGAGNWDIEWADDGSKTWIIQIRPITAPTLRNEVFTYAPIKESMPELPSRFMASLIESCGKDIFQLYRDIDPKLPLGRNYIEVLYGRPMINLSLMMDVMRHWGIPTSSVTASVGGAPANETGANRLRQMRSRSHRFAHRMKAMRAAGESRKLGEEIVEMSVNPGDTITEVVETARTVYTRLMRQMLLLRFAIGEGHRASGKSLGSQMYTDLSPLRQMAAANSELVFALEKGMLPRDTPFRLQWEGWLRKHGHRGVYETDLARPRFRENQAEVLQMIAHPRSQAPVVSRSPFAMLAQKSPQAKAAAAREELRFEAMIAFERIRRRLLDLALPKGVSAEMLFALTVDEVRKLDSGWRPSAEFIRQRKAESAALAELRIPDVIRRNDAIGGEGASRSLHGVGLSHGEAVGKALVLREPTLKLPAGYVPADTILIAPSVDAGWVPTFGLVGGVVVESGGNLSHGSIILRELGIPAVTNVRGASHEIKSGQRIRVVASQGRVEVLS